MGKIIYQDFWHIIIKDDIGEEMTSVFSGETGKYLYDMKTGNKVESITDLYGKNIPLKIL